MKLKTTTYVKLGLRYIQLEVYTFTSSERLETLFLVSEHTLRLRVSGFWLLFIFKTGHISLLSISKVFHEGLKS